MPDTPSPSDDFARASALLYARYGAPRAFVRTFGCQLNESDGEKIQGILEGLGCAFADAPQDADIVILNTCAVRDHAEDRAFGNIGALKEYKRLRPDAILAVCGCMAEEKSAVEALKARFPYVDLVFGTHAIHRLPELFCRALEGRERVFERGGPDEIREGIPAKRKFAFKAWLPVMYGCDNFCTYCIVPYVRGRERSRAPEDVLREAEALVRGGAKEITLLGQNVNSYSGGGIGFPELLRRVNAIPGDFLIRFMTSHPKDCSDDLIEAIRKSEKVERHVHLPFQSGSDRILSAMNRGYTSAQYRARAARLRERVPGLTLTSDVIVGFPGEGREDFEDTLALVKEIRFLSLFTFLYSPREGTSAARMADTTPHEEKTARMAELLAVQQDIAAELAARAVGREYAVLAEEVGRDAGTLAGHTNDSRAVVFDGPAELVGTVQRVRITSARGWALRGERLETGRGGML